MGFDWVRLSSINRTFYLVRLVTSGIVRHPPFSIFENSPSRSRQTPLSRVVSSHFDLKGRISYTKGKSLKDMLVKANLKSLLSTQRTHSGSRAGLSTPFYHFNMLAHPLPPSAKSNLLETANHQSLFSKTGMVHEVRKVWFYSSLTFRDDE